MFLVQENHFKLEERYFGQIFSPKLKQHQTFNSLDFPHVYLLTIAFLNLFVTRAKYPSQKEKEKLNHSLNCPK